MPTASPSLPDAPAAEPRRRRPPAVVRWGLWALILVILFGARESWWPAPWEALARRALVRRDFDAALAWLDYSKILAPRRVESELLRVRAHRGLGDMPQLTKSLNSARRWGASSARIQREQILALAQSGQMSQAEPQLSRLLTDPRGDNLEVCEAYVLGYMRTQQFRLALALLKTWTEDAPDDAQAYFLRARMQMLLQNSSAAADDFQRARELAPSRDDIAIEYAEALRNQNQPREAATLFEQCLEDPGLRIRALVGLAGCRKSLGDPTGAQTLLTQANAENDRYPDAVRELGRLQFEAGNYEAAIQTLRRAVELSPVDDEGHYLLAQSLQLGGHAEEAAAHFQYVTKARKAHRELHELKDALRQQPRDVEILVRAGSINLRYSLADEGVIQLLAALDIAPQHQAALRLLSEYYSQRAAQDPRFRPLADEYRSRLQAVTEPAQ